MAQQKQPYTVRLTIMCAGGPFYDKAMCIRGGAAKIIPPTPVWRHRANILTSSLYRGHMVTFGCIQIARIINKCRLTTPTSTTTVVTTRDEPTVASVCFN